KAEILQVLTSLPTFIGWIAVQLVALAGLFEVLFGWPATPTIIGLGLFALVYTLLGGMWSVGLTDSLQALLLILGLLLLGWHVWQDLASTTGGWPGAWSQITPSRRTWIPTERMTEFVQWLGWLNIAMLGNIPSQDLMQRVFASRSGSIARKACFIAGGAYILLGCVPILVGLSFPILFPNQEIQSVVIQMAQHYLSGGWMVLFLLAVLSMVLSSMDSGILAPATALGRNLLRPHVTPALSTLALCRWSVVLVSIACVMVALLGSRAFELLESCYSIGLAGLLVPLCFGLFTSMGNQTSALLSMSVGIAVWLIEIGFDLEWPVAPLGAVAGCVVYYIHAKLVATSASWMSK
ncbi:MAG: sodium:solute symporter family transporter, partial [Limisphaerales bacterium]